MSVDEPERCERRYDDWGQRNNQVKLPALVVAKILELVRQEDVRSVSCPYDDLELWVSLFAEQVRRSAATGLPPQDAFTLCGPDGGLWDTPVEALGGYVHIPYEGRCGGDLLVWPKGGRFRVPQGSATGKLSAAASVRGCHYVLSPDDFGEVLFATRTMVGDWVLYKSNAPYEPCDVFGVKEIEEIRKRTSARNECERCGIRESAPSIDLDRESANPSADR
jgi:hypothetical protein